MNIEQTSTEKLISLHGGYRKLKSFQVAQLVYDVTARFPVLMTSRGSCPNLEDWPRL